MFDPSKVMRNKEVNEEEERPMSLNPISGHTQYLENNYAQSNEAHIEFADVIGKANASCQYEATEDDLGVSAALSAMFGTAVSGEDVHR